MRRVLDEVTDQVGHRVQLAQDVLVNWEDPSAGRPDAGHDYKELWQVVDKVVPWVYFDSGDRRVSDIPDLVAALSASAPAGSFTVSVGLWGDSAAADGSQQVVITPKQLAAALGAAKSASVNLTPVSLMTDAHWVALDEVWTDWPK